MADLRWDIADGDKPRGALWDEPIFEREPGRGEFRGLEFLHVRARTIINEVKGGDGYLPFRYTINAYRGCSHACSYCLLGSTPVLLADGRTTPIAKLQVGDLVYGTEVRGRYRRYVPTPVLNHWSTLTQAYRITLADGSELVASGDHRFLTDRGWKHVTGAEQGRDRRPHLTIANRMVGVGRLADPPIDDPEYRRGYLTGMIRGDGTVGHYLSNRNGRPQASHRFRLALVDDEALERSEAYLLGLGIRTTSYRFQAETERTRAMRAICASSREAVAGVEAVTAWPTVPSTSWGTGFLAGIFDAKGGCSRGVLRIANCDDRLIAETCAWLHRFGFGHIVEHTRRANGLRFVRVVGGLAERLRFFLMVDPAITRKRTFDGAAVKGRTDLGITSVEPLGVELPMYDITTGTGDFIANGVVSHNCFARPSHAYLNLDTGRDFERRIVVKVNAVERLRVELDPRRWAGDHIAMGTNTDPYQRCEGKYRLTRGIVEVLTEHANPFSILTKGTLVLRDLALLTEAAKRTNVRVNLSIGTLDEQVWRATEPGTPHPMRRVEAVARLNEAGVPCGVLVAPVLPGLSDGVDQLEAVVDACVAAGAVSISTVLLHLRPGVKEHYLESLRRTHPHQLRPTERLYGARSRAPKSDQQRVSNLVHELVRRRGGLTAASSFEPEHLTGRARSAAIPVTSRRRPGPVPGQLGLL